MGNTETKEADSKALQRASYNNPTNNRSSSTSQPAREGEEERENFFLQNPFTYKTPKQRWLEELKANEAENERVADLFIAEELERERLSPELDFENVEMNRWMDEAEALFRDRTTLGKSGEGEGFGKTAPRRWQICGVGLVGGGVCEEALECRVHGFKEKRGVDRGGVGFDKCLARWGKEGEEEEGEGER